MTTRTRRHPLRTVAQLLTVLVVAAVLVVAPEPSIALVPEMTTEAEPVAVAQVAAPESPAAAAVVDELQEHAAIGPAGDAPLGPESPTGEAPPDDPAQLEGERTTGVAEDVAEFRMIGVKYREAEPAEGADGADADHEHEPALVRVRTDGQWGEWFPVEDGAHNPDPEVTGEPLAEGSTDPVWVDRADAFELDLPGEATDVEVLVVREGEAEVEISDGTDAAEGAARGGPWINGRSAWGAAPYRGTPDHGDHVGRAIVHHTVNGNGYSQGQVPSMIRGIQSFHQNGNGWSDIGYNFVIDRFGGIWEGRQDSTWYPIIGAHAQGHNTNTVGIAGLGDFSGAGPGSAMVGSYQRLVGWKLSLSGTTPNSNTVLGHRNVGQTGCPGNGLYNQLGTIRAGARTEFDAQHPTPRFGTRLTDVVNEYTPITGDWDGDWRTDVFWYGPGGDNDYTWYGNSNKTFSGKKHIVHGVYEPISGDFSGDGKDDIFWYAPGEAQDAAWYGRPGRTFAGKQFNVNGVYEPVVEDFDGDGRDDILWYAPGPGQDTIWFGKPNHTFLGRHVTINGDYTPVTGDFDGDHYGDVLWYGPGSVNDFIWYGNGSSRLTSVATTINGSDYVPVTGDFNRNGRDDVLFYRAGDGADPMWVNYANRTWRTVNFQVRGTYLPLEGDFNGDLIDEVFWYGPGAGSDAIWYGS